MTTKTTIDFERALIAANEEIRRICYNPARFLEMINERGALQAAHDMMAKATLSDGLSSLIMHGRPDLSLEAHVLKEQFADLFSDEEKRVARERLGIAKNMLKTVSSLVLILALTVASLVPMGVSAETNSYTFRLALHFDRAPYQNMVCRYSRALGDDRYEVILNAIDGSIVASAPMSEIASESTSGLTRHYVWELSLAYGYRLGAKIRDTHTGNWWPIAQATNSGRELVWPNADGDSYATGCVGLIDASPAPTATPSPTATSTITPEPPLPQPPTVTPTPTSTPVMAPAAPVHRIRLPLVYNCPANPASGSPCAP